MYKLTKIFRRWLTKIFTRWLTKIWYKFTKAQYDGIAGWFNFVQDAKAEGEVIAADMDLGRMHPNDDGWICDQGWVQC